MSAPQRTAERTRDEQKGDVPDGSAEQDERVRAEDAARAEADELQAAIQLSLSRTQQQSIPAPTAVAVSNSPHLLPCDAAWASFQTLYAVARDARCPHHARIGKKRCKDGSCTLHPPWHEAKKYTPRKAQAHWRFVPGSRTKIENKALAASRHMIEVHVKRGHNTRREPTAVPVGERKAAFVAAKLKVQLQGERAQHWKLMQPYIRARLKQVHHTVMCPTLPSSPRCPY